MGLRSLPALAEGRHADPLVGGSPPLPLEDFHLTIDLNALWFLLVGAAVIGSIKVLINRLNTIETTLVDHGLDLREIKTKIGIKVNPHE